MHENKFAKTSDKKMILVHPSPSSFAKAQADIGYGGQPSLFVSKIILISKLHLLAVPTEARMSEGWHPQGDLNPCFRRERAMS